MKAILLFLFLMTSAAQIGFAAEAEVAIRAPIDDSKDADMEGIAWTKKHKLQYIMRDCPVIGNTESGIYHMPGQPHYQRMLVVNKCAKKGKCKDNRRCFEDESEASATEYCSKKGGCRKYKKSTATLK